MFYFVFMFVLKVIKRDKLGDKKINKKYVKIFGQNMGVKYVGKRKK